MYYDELLPANVREEMRSKLEQLRNCAIEVYPRPNLLDEDISPRRVIETVLYSFDNNNRRAVASKLHLTDKDLIILLCGYVLGWEAAWV